MWEGKIRWQPLLKRVKDIVIVIVKNIILREAKWEKKIELSAIYTWDQLTEYYDTQTWVK